MTLLTAHKILISAAVVMFAGLSLRELYNYTAGDAAALLRSVLSGAAAVGGVLYLRWVWIHRPSDTSSR